MEYLKELQHKLGITFKNEALLKTAFTHSSYANENGEASYERLEFLGDSILNFVVADVLFKKHPKKNEGFLTVARAEIVSGKNLATVAEKMEIVGFMRTGNGVIATEAKSSQKVKASLFEAIVGAIYLDLGMEKIEKFIVKTLF
jgi:ribonuclease-3